MKIPELPEFPKFETCHPDHPITIEEHSMVADLEREKLNVQAISKNNLELAAEIADLEYRLSCLLCHVTGNLLSKPNYTKEAMFSAADDCMDRVVERETNELRAAHAELVEALRKHIEKYCPKSTNQSACTWMHDYQDLKQALAKHGGGE